MTRRFSVLLLSLAVALAVALPAFAQQTVVITFQSVVDTSAQYDGYYAGEYQGTINGSSTKTNFICDDFLTDIVQPQSWQANVNSNQGLSNDPAGTPSTSDPVRYAPQKSLAFGTFPVGYYNIENPYLVPGTDKTLPGVGTGLTQQEEYNMIAYLVNLIFTGPQSNWGHLSGAIWSIADCGWSAAGQSCNPSSAVSTAYDAATQAYVTQAFGERDTTQPTFTVYTPNGGSCTGYANCEGNGQEFWAQNPVATPEPAAIVLLAWGTLALALAPLVSKLRRKKLLA